MTEAEEAAVRCSRGITRDAFYDDLALAVLEAVEPIIRRDERMKAEETT